MSCQSIIFVEGTHMRCRSSSRLHRVFVCFFQKKCRSEIFKGRLVWGYSILCETDRSVSRIAGLFSNTTRGCCILFDDYKKTISYSEVEYSMIILNFNRHAKWPSLKGRPSVNYDRKHGTRVDRSVTVYFYQVQTNREVLSPPRHHRRLWSRLCYVGNGDLIPQYLHGLR